MAEPIVKPEPEGSSPTGVDEDIYEDTGDLEFYDPVDQNGSHDRMYLARIPQYVWDKWNKTEAEDDVRIGTIRSWSEPDGNGGYKNCMRLLLTHDSPQHQGVPKEYDLDFPIDPKTGQQQMSSKNLFIFSEQDLPGFKSKNKLRAEGSAAGIPHSILRSKDRVEKPGQQAGAHGKRGKQDYYKKAIPKKTTLYGRVRHELNCIAVDNPETRYIANQRALEVMKSTKKVQFGDINRGRGIRVIGGGTIAGHDASKFINTAPTVPKVKKADTKAARIPENELLDQIFTAFKDYRFWSMKALKARIPQPEGYLRATLEKVAEMHRSGKWANNWELKSEHCRQDSAKEEAQAEAEGEESGDEDDLDVKMEDVMPQ